MLGVLLLLGGLLRFTNLENTPPGLRQDEAYNGLDALQAQQNEDYQVFYPENDGREGLYINSIALSFEYFGVNNGSLRLASAFLGVLTLMGFYLLLKDLRFSPYTRLLGLFMLSFSFWHLNFSRLAYRGIMAPFLLVWIFYFFFRGVDCKRNPKHQDSRELLFFGISGLLLGIGFHTYLSFRVAPLILLVIAFSLAISVPHFFRRYWKDILVFIFAAAAAAAPLILYFVEKPADFTGQNHSVSVFNAPDMSFWEASSQSLVMHLGAFVFYGDTNQGHNHEAQPLLPLSWAILFIWGFALSCRRIFQGLKDKLFDHSSQLPKFFFASILAQSIFWIMLIPGFLNIEGAPDALRIIGVIPGVFILIALPLEKIFQFHHKVLASPTEKDSSKKKEQKSLPTKDRFKLWIVPAILVILILSGLLQVYTYFSSWAKDPQTASAMEKELYDLGLLTKKILPRESNYLVVKPQVFIGRDRADSSLKVTQFAGYPQIENYRFYHPLEALELHPEKLCLNSRLVFQESDQWLRDQFQEKCPNLEWKNQSPQPSAHDFWVLE